MVYNICIKNNALLKILQDFSKNHLIFQKKQLKLNIAKIYLG
jgi:hypothetical protein